ncbi:hypothetical protein QBA38_21685 [Streptomyces stelliscabiei]|uniref:hypothetical protein n=1 Tax=Streptomyces stelliscabiei TaxID=146820 RepID=UPI002FF1DC27
MPETEKKLTAEVQSALDAVTDQGSSMVESGVERVSDGVHTQPSLAKDATYKVAVVCSGKGDTEIVFTRRRRSPATGLWFSNASQPRTLSASMFRESPAQQA